MIASQTRASPGTWAALALALLLVLPGPVAAGGDDPRSLLEAGRLREAVQAAERLLESASGLQAADLLGVRGEALYGLGRFAEAELSFARALEVLPPGQVDLRAEFLVNRGASLHRAGRDEEAVPLYREALGLREESRNGPAYNNLGASLQALLRFAEARQAFTRAASLRLRAGDRVGAAVSLGNLASLLHTLGHLEQARARLREGLDLDPPAPVAASLWVGLGREELALGRPEQAEESFRRGLQLAGPDSEAGAEALSGLGAALLDTGDLGAARRSLEQALASRRRRGDLRGEARDLNRLAACLGAEGEWRAAEALLLPALELRRRAGDLRGEAATRSNLARALLEQGRRAEALAQAELALEAFLRSGDRAGQAAALGNLARLLEQPDAERALGLYRRAVDLVEEMGAGLAAEALESYSHSREPLYDALVELLLRLGRPAEAFEVLERKHRFESRSAFEPGQLPVRDPAVKGLLERAEELRLRGERLVALEARERGVSGQVQAATQEKLAANRREFFAVLQDLRSRDPEYAAFFAVPPVMLADLQRRMPEGWVLVEYFPGREALYLFVVTRAGLSMHRVGITREELDQRVIGLVRLMTRRAPDVEEPSRQLYELLIGPLGEHLGPETALAVIPSGLLHYVPFAALVRPGEDGPERFLGVHRRLARLTSGEVLDVGTAAPGSLDILAFGNPDRTLPAAESEVQAIARLVPGTRSFLREEATRERLDELAPAHEVIHLATHGELDPDPLESYLVFAPGPDRSPSRLTCQDVYGLDLARCALVVLSDCNTAVSRERPGQEVVSLAQAFSVAGASRVVASLWSVEDVSTSVLMENFYREYSAGAPPDEALRRARSAVASHPDTAHPFFWAAFVFLGAPAASAQP